MHTTIKKILLGSLLGAGSIATAHAGLLTYQGVTFNSAWSGNVLTLEIDAANRNGDWTRAKGLAALELNGIGNYTGVRVTTAPGGTTGWTTSSSELNASGCSGDTNGQAGSRLCFFGQQIALADNMVFSFTFSGKDIQAVDPHVKVEFVNAKGRKVGSLLSQTLPASPAASTGTSDTTTGGTTAGTTTGTQTGGGAATTPVVPAAPASTPNTPATSASASPAPVTETPAAPVTTPVVTETATSTAADNPLIDSPLLEIPAQDILASAELPPAVPTGDTRGQLQAGSQDTSEAGGGASPAAVPEPQSIVLLLGGLGLMGLAAGRKRRA